MVLWRAGRPRTLSSLGSMDWRRLEAARDRIMAGLGTSEPWIEGHMTVAATWRRPLRVDEVNQLPADNPRVRERAGRA